MYHYLQAKKEDTEQFIKDQQFGARDNSRTPFQWDNSVNAGFTTGKPWIEINKNYTTINEGAEENDPNSSLNYFRKIVKLRKDNLVLVYGKYTLLDRDNPNVYAYTRDLDGKKFLVLLNFTSKVASFNTGLDMSNAKLLLDNYSNPSKGNNTLQPYEAAVYEL